MEVKSGDLGPMLSHEDFVSAVAWSPDGSLLASAAGGTVNGEFAPLVYLWDSVSGQQVTTLIQKAPAMSLAFSPDGRELAILDSTGSLYLWVVQE
jgi:WD40 repeat protein